MIPQATTDNSTALQQQPHKVITAHCESYQPATVEYALEELLKPLGGMGNFVKPGQKVLIKPNMLTNRDPEMGVTTHPELVRAVIHVVRNAGGEPSVGDSPASAVKIDRVLQETGFVELCAEEDVPLIHFEADEPVNMSVDGFSFSLAKAVVEADVVINMPKVKTHVLTTLTAAVKNTYGCIPGYQKAMLHKQYLKIADFGRLVAAIHKAAAPQLQIADGIIGMEGAGPSGGKPVKLNLLAASADGTALDLALCELLHINPKAVPYLPPNIPGNAAYRLTDIKLNGIPATGRRVELPNTFAVRMIPRRLSNLIEPFIWIRPAIDDSCIKCGRCVKACPVKALAMQPGEKPVLTPKSCIGCCCCHEVCPANAIEMTQSPLMNLIRRGKMP